MFANVATLQFEITPGDSPVNLGRVEKLFYQLQPEPGTLIVLPELWAYGFDYDASMRLAEETPYLLEALKRLASTHSVYFAGSLLEKTEGNDKPYNTLFVTGPNGPVGTYRKQHLFGLWKEDLYFSSGNRFRPIDTEFGSLGALICYDLRFPHLASLQAFQGAGLIVVSAQWPEVRVDHWRTLLRARAIENQVFIGAANGCGPCGSQILAGHSMIIGPDGTILAEAGEKQETVTAPIHKESMDVLRNRFCSVGERSFSSFHSDKLVDPAQLQKVLFRIRRQGSRIAFTNGCFDILHSGHVDYLEQARRTADCLVVGLNSDASVKRIKGSGRPVNAEMDRARVLAGLGCVDFVILFDEDTPQNLIASLKPDVLVKGADWEEEAIVGADEVRKRGGKVVRIPFAHDVSTTRIISKIHNRETA